MAGFLTGADGAVGRVAIVVLAIALAGCNSGTPDAQFASLSSPGANLAIEYKLVFETDSASVESAFHGMAEACAAVASNGCSVVSSRLSDRFRASSEVTLRAVPESVDGLVAAARSFGRLVEQSTNTSDLTEAVRDIGSRIAMLKDQRRRLLELQASALGDVESLIKIAEQLANVQTELEKAEADSANTALQIERNILSMQFQSDEVPAFGPVIDALRDFGGNLLRGLASAIRGLAFVLPWFLLVVLPLGLIVRWGWRHLKRS